MTKHGYEKHSGAYRAPRSPQRPPQRSSRLGPAGTAAAAPRSPDAESETLPSYAPAQERSLEADEERILPGHTAGDF